MKNFLKNLMIIEFDAGMQQKVAMFNSTVISEADVKYLIENSVITDEHFPNIVVMTKRQYLSLFDKQVVEESAVGDTFYSELIMEQGEQG